MKTAIKQTRESGADAHGNASVMTVRQAADFLQCHMSTLYRLAKRGQIPAFRLGGGWRFTWQALERWMLGGEPELKPAPDSRPTRRKKGVSSTFQDLVL